MKAVILPWASSITLDDKKIEEAGYTSTKLLASTAFAGEKTGSFSIQPQEVTFDNKILKSYTVAVELKPKEGNNKGKIAVVGDSDFLSDNFVQSNYQNGTFGLNLLAFLGQDDMVSAIGSRKTSTGKLLFKSDNDPATIKWGFLAAVFLVPALYAVLRLTNRKKLQQQVYAKNV